MSCLLGLAGCEGFISDPNVVGPPAVGAQCTAPVSAANPIRRLTPAQYRASTAALFPGINLPSVTLFTNSNAGGYENNTEGQGVTDQVISEYSAAAVAIAAAATSEPSWTSCDITTSACVASTAETLAERTYRRPLTSEERAFFRDYVTTDLAEFAGPEALAIFIEGLLQTPQFLYLPESGDTTLPAPGGQTALTGVELASRLSYLLWNEPPDEELAAAAASSLLLSDAGLATQVDRMMADPRFEVAMDRFFAQWLELDGLGRSRVSRDQFPELFQAGVQDDLERSALAFLQYAFFEESDLNTLFTSRQGFANDRIAPFFGVAPPGSDDALVPVQLPESERAGILTHPAVLASTSHGTTHSPILRGLLVLEKVLCFRPPPPPPNVLDGTQTGGAEFITTRQKVEAGHGTAECATCHEAIDGMGFTFENFDAIGRFRTTENGQQVDPSGILRGSPVENAVALGEELANDQEAAECVTVQLLEHALARTLVGGDRCQVDQLATQLFETGDLRALFRTLLLSNAFRFAPRERE